MKMKTKRKALLLSLCAVLLVVASVMGTMAYLTAQDSVTNTFTVGKVGLTLDEAKVDTDGKKTDAPRVKANSYTLLPGKDYDKDPIVHVTAGSEDSWIFVKVENGLAAYEAGQSTSYDQITKQITDNGWVAVPNTTGVYYKEYSKTTPVAEHPVFENFKIADDANGKPGWENITATNAATKIIVTAYAVQKTGLTVEDAWGVAESSNN